MKTGNINKNSDNGVKTKFRINRKLLFFLLGLLPLIVLISWHIQTRHESLRKEQEAREFLEQVITSINNETEFYKIHTNELNLKDIEANKDGLSKDYKIHLIDFDPGHYEYEMEFSGGKRFYIVVIKFEEGYHFSHFRPLKKSVE
jgi:hypothetical protein